MAASAMVPATAFAGDPLLPTADGWVSIAKDGTTYLPGGPRPVGSIDNQPQSEISNVQFNLVKVPNSPVETLTSVTLERPRGEYDHPWSLVMGSGLSHVFFTVRRPAVDGKADWFFVNLIDPKVTADEVRTKQGSTTSTEVLMLTFSKMIVYHRVQTADAYTTYAVVPPQFDIKTNVVLAPAAPPSHPVVPTPIHAEPIRAH